MQDSLDTVIAAALAEWDVPHVELAIHGSAAPGYIARQIREACVRELQCAPSSMWFYRASVGAVAGLVLESGARIVLKAHQPAVTLEHLHQVVRLQLRIESQLQLAPKVLAGPFRFGNGHAIIEECVERGAVADGHRPQVRRELARSLHSIIECVSGATEVSQLSSGILLDLARPQLWPQPHSKLFDFAATSAGAQYIDAPAALARSRMMPAGRQIIGHGDWRAEHVRFDADRATVGFDWDSLSGAHEAALVGATAHMFCADWSLEEHVQAPTLQEASAFVADYEAARGRAFDRDERSLCAASFVFAVAYTSRCGHAAGVDSRAVPGTFQHLLVSEGERLFDL